MGGLNLVFQYAHKFTVVKLKLMGKMYVKLD